MKNRLYYGWIIVSALAVTEMVSWGVLFYGFTVLQTPMVAELGWSKSQMAGAFSLSMLVGGISGVPIGRWLDRRGPRLPNARLRAEPWGARTFIVADPDGNLILFASAMSA